MPDLQTLALPLALPRPPLAANGIPLSPKLRDWLDDSIARWDRELVRALEQDLRALVKLVNQLVEVANGAADLDAFMFQDDLIGTKDGVNTTFAFPHSPRIGKNGIPQAQVYWKTGLMVYAPDAPMPLMWTLDGSNAVMGVPPLAGDSLFAYVIAA